MGYKKILVAVELNSVEDERLVEKAQMIAQLDPDAEVYILNVIEYIDSYLHVASVANDIDTVIMAYATESMKTLCDKFKIPTDHSIIEIGVAKSVILQKAEEEHYDLIIVGSHGKHGFRFLLGSTADRVLNAAPCDILSVRVEYDDTEETAADK